MTCKKSYANETKPSNSSADRTSQSLWILTQPLIQICRREPRANDQCSDVAEAMMEEIAQLIVHSATKV